MNTALTVGISLVAGASIALGLSKFIFYPKAVPQQYTAGPRGIPFGQFTSLFTWFKVLWYFLPYALFLFGVIYDGLVQKIKFFPSGFVGLLAVYANWLISTLLNGGTTVLDQDVCGIPGMSSSGSNVAPQALLFNVTVMSHIASYISASQSDSSYSALSWLGVAVVTLIGIAQYQVNDCYNRSSGWRFTFIGWFTPLVLAVAAGLLIGGLSGYGISTISGDSVGIGISSEAKQTLTSGKGPALAPTTDTAGAGKCSPTGDDDQFVCEAYKNGELVTSTIVE